MIIDFHAHLYPPSFMVRREEIMARDETFGLLFGNPKARIASAPELLLAMDKAKVDVTVVVGLGWTNVGVAREANEYILRAAASSDGRLVPFCSVSPNWGQEALDEIERCVERGARGIGELHPDTQGFDITDAGLMAPMMDAAREMGLIVLVHSSEPVGHCYAGKGKTTPDKLWSFIQNFPDNRIVCAHWGGGLPFYALMPEVREGLENVYFDTAASPFLYTPDVFESVTSLIGAEKILLGTDYPLLSQTRLLKQVNGSPLTDEQKRLILGGNGQKLLNL